MSNQNNDESLTEKIQDVISDEEVKKTVHKIAKWVVIIVGVVLSYVVLRWFIGPPGVLIDTTHLSGFSKLFYDITNSIKMPRKFVIN